MKALSDKQLRILAFPKMPYDALICDGAIRAGKTSVMIVAFVSWAMQTFDRCNFGICSKTVNTAIKNIIKPLLAMTYMRERYSMKYKQMTGELIITARSGRTNTFYVYGGKDESSYMLIQGITLAGVLLDEVALMPRSFVEQALARCSVDGRKFWFNCNPEGATHWFYREWIKQPEKHNAMHLHFTMDDNPSLTENVRRGYESMYSGVFYQRYILGLWVMAEGVIYDMFEYKKHVITGTPETDGDCFVSCDFGIQNATVFLMWQKMRNSNQWVCLREWYYSGREERKQVTCDELVKGLKEMLNGIVPRQVIVDPSAAALIAELRKNEYHVIQARNEVIDGISDVSTLLKQNQLLFHERCTHTIEEFGVYQWDGKAADHGDDRPIKENDHCMDAVRYFVRTRRIVRKIGGV